MKRILGIVTVITLSITLSACGMFDKDEKPNSTYPTVDESLLPSEDRPAENVTQEVDGEKVIVTPEPKEGEGVYYTLEGEYITTNINEPLNEIVVADLKERIKRIPDFSSLTDEERNAAIQQWVVDLLDRTSEATKIQPVIIWTEIGNFSVEDKEATKYYATSLNNQSDKPEELITVIIAGKTVEEVVDSAKEFASEQKIEIGQIFELP